MIPWRNTVFSYGIVARFFHWLIGLTIIGMLALGLYMSGLPNDMNKLSLIGWHKSIGVLVLTAALLRWLWRQANIVPALPADTGALARFGARASHFLLYAMMFYMPIVGVLMSNAAGYPVSVFGLRALPSFIAPDKSRAHLLGMMHNYGGYFLIGLVSVHALAALYHHFIRRDNILKRMWVW